MTILVSQSVDQQADELVQKIKHYLITTMGRVLDEANADEFYRALCYALREQIMIHWQATAQTWAKKDVRTVFYLSMEYLPGRFLYNNLGNLKEVEVVQLALKKVDRCFSDISAIEYDPGLGNGGLGRLASCYLDSLATLKMPARGYGLRYQYGLFEQQIWDGVQIEKPDLWLISENPWEFRRDLRKTAVRFSGTPVKKINLIGEEVYDLTDYEEVWAIPYDISIVGYSPTPDFSVVTLRLWTTKESPRNFQLQRYNAGRIDQAAENTVLTDVLYPSDAHDTGKRTRLKQEFLLASSSIQDIFRYYNSFHDDVSNFHNKVRIQINDSHPTVLIAELMRLLTTRYLVPWKKAWEMTQECVGYTNHTVLQEALEQWDQNTFKYLLPRQYKIIERINYEFCNDVRIKFPGEEDRVRKMSIIENGQVRMANLAIAGSHKVNGVAAIHSEILKNQTFREFYEMYPDRFTNVTNGVTQRRWLLNCNPELSDFIIERIGRDWICDFSQIAKIAEYANDETSLRRFLEVKRIRKQKLLDFINQDARPRDAQGKPMHASITLDNSALFDVQIKRVHEYKRQLMNALRVIIQYHDILDNPSGHHVKRLVIFGGKAAASYETAKNIIRLICCIAKKVNSDPVVSQFLNVDYVENYNVTRAEVVIPATDLSEQISTAGMEASGTSNMKFAINGALTIGTEDGANIEMRQEVTDSYWPFRFGCTAQEIQEMKTRQNYKAWDIYSQNPKIKRAVDALRDRSLASLESEHQSLSSLYYALLEGAWGAPSDRFFVLKDLEDYLRTQKKVDELYETPLKWAEYAIHNIAGMGRFSSDRAVLEYCREIWGIESCPIDPQILDKIQSQFV